MSLKRQKHYMVFRRPRTQTIRAINNTIVLTIMTSRALEEVKKQVRDKGPQKIGFEIPSTSGENIIVQRQRARILELLEEAVTRRLYEQSLIMAVALTEDYLQKTLRTVLLWHPHKLGTNIAGMPVSKQVSLDDVLAAQNIRQLTSRIVEKQLVSLFHESPTRYFQYIEKVLSVSIDKQLKEDFIELKATRDLVVHNSGVVNELYVHKAGKKARADVGEPIPIDSKYFAAATKCMKRLIQAVYSQVLRKYGSAKIPQELKALGSS